MAKRKKKNKRSKKPHTPKISAVTPAGKGFDFGLKPKVALLPDFAFNELLSKAEVIGCAYGFCHFDDETGHIPCITLVGQNGDILIEVYKIFQNWGCKEDGDVICMDILLNDDGSYDLWITPEFERMRYRIQPQAELFDALLMNLSWIKHIDTTNDFLYTLKEHCQKLLSPVVVNAATCKDITQTDPDLSPIKEWEDILMFNFRILSSQEANKDPMYSLIARGKGKKKGYGKKTSEYTPETIAANRLNIFDTAFPVSRERIKTSSLMEQVRALDGFESVVDEQIVQAAVNIALSAELNDRDFHYSALDDSYEEAIFDHILNRVEHADGTPYPESVDAEVIAKQIHLDVIKSLQATKIKTSNRSFLTLQKIFIDKGFANG